MHILIWHGWLLEGSGSNIGAARTAEVWRAAGHDVVLLCQERHPERYPWIDSDGLVDGDGPRELTDRARGDAVGRCVLLRPTIGKTLPVFVVDRYEGFDDVRRFVDLSDDELESYLRANVDALRAAATWHRSDVVVTGHAIPGAAIGRRALGAGRYVAKVHGSDLEYAVRLQDRLGDLAREGLSGARAVLGPANEVLERCADFVPQVRHLARVVPPGVDIAAFRPRPRAEALLDVADRLARDPDTERGRPSDVDARVEHALEARDSSALDAIGASYDQAVPEPEAAARLRALAASNTPIVGFLGKLIPQKGVALLLAAHQALAHDAEALIVGFGSHRERLAALAMASRRDGARRGVTFTGRLDHRYAPGAVAAMDVIVVPSILHEAFGMVAAEGAAAGALPVVARHSGLAEVAAALEGEVGRPGLFSFEPGEGAVERLTASVDRLLGMSRAEREDLRAAVSGFVGRTWTWERTASKILAAW